MKTHTKAVKTKWTRLVLLIILCIGLMGILVGCGNPNRGYIRGLEGARFSAYFHRSRGILHYDNVTLVSSVEELTEWKEDIVWWIDPIAHEELIVYIRQRYNDEFFESRYLIMLPTLGGGIMGSRSKN